MITSNNLLNLVRSISEGRDETSTRLAMARSATDTNPSEKEIEDDSYDKGKLSFHGLPIAIENPKGSTRSGTDPSGTKWSVIMQHDYGEILRSDGADGDPVDVFIGDQVESKVVYVVDQFMDGEFDEHKVMLGFTHVGEAKDGYLINYADDWEGLKWITPASLPDLKDWLNNGDTKKPFHDWSMNISESTMRSAHNILSICESLGPITERFELPDSVDTKDMTSGQRKAYVFGYQVGTQGRNLTKTMADAYGPNAALAEEGNRAGLMYHRSDKSNEMNESTSTAGMDPNPDAGKESMMTFKDGAHVMVNNAKTYDNTSMDNTVMGTVMGQQPDGSYMVKVGEGEYAIKSADITLKSE
ncbi:inorganic pyrophosphatase [Vibrio phage 1.031.O._10N.261.46.F8]|nr:inorganic pyrophosphatase [Vibrio phage 1.031.O._10N.261.46.F8]